MAIAAALKTNTTLNYLKWATVSCARVLTCSLNVNPIGPAAAKAIVDALAGNTMLQHLL